MNDSPIDRLCELFGVANDYHDITGARHHVPEGTRRQLLLAMGVLCSDDEDVGRVLHEAEEQEYRRQLPPVAVGRAGDDCLLLDFTLPEAESYRPVHWHLTEEAGRTANGSVIPAQLEARTRRVIDGNPWIRVTLPVAAPGAEGYHRMRLYEDGSPREIAQCLVVWAPKHCYRPRPLAEGNRLWGLTAQLYGLRSQRNWGIGDFTDLLRLVELAAGNGAAFVGLNPLHSPLRYDDAHASPYDPSSRRFLNALYLDVEAIPDFEESKEARELVADEDFQAELRSLRAAELVDYQAIGALKHKVLHLLFESFRGRHLGEGSDRARAFEEFRRDRGRLLHQFASFQVLYEHWYGKDPQAWGWPAWPEEFRDSNSEAVAGFLESRADRILYFMYLQWNADLQLTAAADRGDELGMPIGIYADLALSSKNGGADTWIDRDLFMTGAHLGAPPDPFNQAGQDWGLPPWNPARLRAAGFRPFIDTLRANMRIGGALRIDHVMALMRCFLLPEGSRGEGTYVHYPFDEMRAILALESQRHRCLVIGEDLGTVPEEVRRGLSDIGVLGYRVLYFEKNEQGSYKKPDEFDTDVLTVISTHDLPTLVGFWQGADIEWRTAEDLFPSAENREQQLVARAEDRARLMVALEQQQLVPEEPAPTELRLGAEMSPDLSAAFHRYLARSASLLVGIQLEDLLQERDQANLPGTTTEHPNWRRRLSLTLESWMDEPQIAAILSTFREERPRAGANGRRPAESSQRRASIPRVTYRLQLNKDFRFADAEALVPYLAELGISHVYCSPYMKARAGSTHGYDVVDHNAFNPEIGDRAEFERFCNALAAHDMGHILDMVPNHMAVTGRDHEWWLDVLENGPASRFADFFDIDWQPLKEELRGKVLLPVLGDHYGNVLDRGELRLVFDDATGSFAVEYFEHGFPVDPKEYPQILQPDIGLLRTRLREGDASLLQFESLVTAFGNLPGRDCSDQDVRRERARDQGLHQQRLAALAASAPDIRRYIDECLRTFNGDEQYPADVARLHQLLESQAYRLAYWRVASHEINYRRFFDINELASLRMENPEVFEATHGLVLELIENGKLQGVRIDHPDGLFDPRGYFRTLQQHTGLLPPDFGDHPAELPLYMLAEKILAGEETLRDDWPIHGTTGYEFANLVNRFLVRPDGLEELDAAYHRFIGRSVAYDDILHRSKTLIMQTSLASELNVLAAELDRLAEHDPHTRDFGLGGLRSALLETVACFSVYRTYCVDGEVSEEDSATINDAVDTAKGRSEAADTSVFEFLRDVLLNRIAAGRSEELRSRVARFGMRLQQYTSPVAAKGMEDTAFYRYARLLSLNEVGGTPEQPAASTEEFHAANLERSRRWPHSMLASSTHDTKRSEDVRARLHVISEVAAEWKQHVELWSQVNEPFRGSSGEPGVVDRETEYFLYQTLLGAWPSEHYASWDESAHQEFSERMSSYMVKAVKEAKRHTSWLNPDPEYEKNLRNFVAALLDPASNHAFMEDFLPFQRRVARLGLYNALAAVLLKLTCPGVPDIYQGNELWRFDLVDPDNRRPVDFGSRRRLLSDIRERFDRGEGQAMLAEFQNTLVDGAVKLFVTWRALAVRRQYPALFERGAYEPLTVSGEGAEHVLAFARRGPDVTAVVAVMRWLARIPGCAGEKPDVSGFCGTSIELPADELSYTDAFTGVEVSLSPGTQVLASDMFAGLPVALWTGVRR